MPLPDQPCAAPRSASLSQGFVPRAILTLLRASGYKLQGPEPVQDGGTDFRPPLQPLGRVPLRFPGL